MYDCKYSCEYLQSYDLLIDKPNGGKLISFLSNLYNER